MWNSVSLLRICYLDLGWGCSLFFQLLFVSSLVEFCIKTVRDSEAKSRLLTVCMLHAMIIMKIWYTIYIMRRYRLQTGLFPIYSNRTVTDVTESGRFVFGTQINVAQRRCHI